jgi:putative transposase
MVKKGYTPEQIINKLREAEILLNQSETVAVISKKIGVSAHTYYRWRKEYGGMRVGQARRLKELELWGRNKEPLLWLSILPPSPLRPYFTNKASDSQAGLNILLI